MNATVDPDSPIGREARAWALAVFGEPFPPERSAELRRWLDAAPAHAAAYRQAEAVLLALGELETLAAPTPTHATKPLRAHVLRPAAWAGGMTALAACLVAALFVAQPPAALESGVQARQVALKDGSAVVLAPGSRLIQASRWNDRRYELERGEAFFTVRKAEGRRFQVAVGKAEIEVLGTRFDARAGAGGQVRVAVEEGRVAVYEGPTRRQVARLGAGDFVLLENGRTEHGRLTAPTEAAAWRAGRLAYADAPLGDVIADLTARGHAGLKITPRAAALRITASFQLDQAERFIASLPEILPVRIEVSEEWRTIDVRSVPRPTAR
ncbi:FecR family protein [Caulobacter endophyticus]|uniref:FecR family protein n=1 Tax=Caulobacter endophyticus TaxID=2172652 RepID=UPI00240F5B25|nr:FecR domain-containing protein [Caulobacter endophyticus]MDG2531590.1 FecR domain-containing protein [Caulobacter endophyticus]